MTSGVRLAVTTPLRPSREDETEARAAAERHGLPYAPRGRRPAAEVAREAAVDALLVVSPRASILAVDGEERRWSAAVGPRGRVVGLEGSPVLAAWVAEGLRRLPDEAARRIEIRSGEHGGALADLPERSFDVVLFDPMFRHARAEPAGFDLVRQLADARPLSPDALARARRVARRWVLVKDGAPGWDLARLGLVPLPSARGAHRYYARVAAGCRPLKAVRPGAHPRLARGREIGG